VWSAYAPEAASARVVTASEAFTKSCHTVARSRRALRIGAIWSSTLSNGETWCLFGRWIEVQPALGPASRPPSAASVLQRRSRSESEAERAGSERFAGSQRLHAGEELRFAVPNGAQLRTGDARCDNRARNRSSQKLAQTPVLAGASRVEGCRESITDLSLSSQKCAADDGDWMLV